MEPPSPASRPFGAPRRRLPDLVLPQEVHASRKRLLVELSAGAYLVWYGTFLFHKGLTALPPESGPLLYFLLVLGPWVVAFNGLLTGLPALLFLLSGRPRLRLTEEGIEVRHFGLLRTLLPWNEVGDIRRSRWPFHTSSVTIRRRRARGASAGPGATRRAPGLRAGRVRIDARNLSMTSAELERLLRLQAFAQPFRERA